MSRSWLHTAFVYCIRRTAKESVYRSSRNPRFVLTVRTLGMTAY